jgi:hypothetical protein
MSLPANLGTPYLHASRATGYLESLSEDPITYFEGRGLHGPHDLQTPTRVF